jgi:hypothetical protein
MKSRNKVELALNAMYEFRHVPGTFNRARINAEKAGKLLACMLALRFPFTYQTVSLVGFSLGTQVIKSCLETLHEIYG